MKKTIFSFCVGIKSNRPQTQKSVYQKIPKNQLLTRFKQHPCQSLIFPFSYLSKVHRSFFLLFPIFLKKRTLIIFLKKGVRRCLILLKLSQNKFYNRTTYHMYFNKFDSYYYSRPVSYRSYYPKVSGQSDPSDTETQELLNFFRKNNIQVQDLGGLSRGIVFGDLLVERRVFNHNSGAYYASTDYVIRQWKSTNDLASYHPTGTHYVAKSFPELLAKLQKVIQDQGIALK